MNQIIKLVEYQPAYFVIDEISESIAQTIWQSYGHIIEIQPPSMLNRQQWQLTSQGWVGHIPVTSNFSIQIQPKVSLNNIFGMLEYAYNLKSFHLLDGWHQSTTIAEFYDLLAGILAQRILNRVRRGLYRAYIPQVKKLSAIRGRINIAAQIRQPWETQLECHYQEQTADIADNQILLWTIRQIMRRQLCSDRVSVHLRQAYHALQGSITLAPYAASNCLGRIYHRLNEDYQILHALCRFFLEDCGPQLDQGQHKMLPFLVNTANLYEQFVAQWLKVHSQKLLAPHGLKLVSQMPVYLNADRSIQFTIDLALKDIATDQVYYVIDTKYKNPSQPATKDIQQIIAYATVTGAREAILLYPQMLSKPLETKITGDLRVRSLAFCLDNDLEQNGLNFLNQLIDRQADELVASSPSFAASQISA